MSTIAQPNSSAASSTWLRTYYLVRAGVSLAWIALAVTVGRSNPTLAAILLVAYPLWDAIANALDANQSGGLRANPSQALNFVVSAITAVAVALALGISMNAVFGVFAVWVALSGLLQLGTAVRRWKTAGAQWLMVLSGAQSALAAISFVLKARDPASPDLSALVFYAAFGAFYFLVSGVWLAIKLGRQSTALAH